MKKKKKKTNKFKCQLFQHIFSVALCLIVILWQLWRVIDRTIVYLEQSSQSNIEFTISCVPCSISCAQPQNTTQWMSTTQTLNKSITWHCLQISVVLNVEYQNKKKNQIFAHHFCKNLFGFFGWKLWISLYQRLEGEWMIPEMNRGHLYTKDFAQKCSISFFFFCCIVKFVVVAFHIHLKLFEPKRLTD